MPPKRCGPGDDPRDPIEHAWVEIQVEDELLTPGRRPQSCPTIGTRPPTRVPVIRQRGPITRQEVARQ